jgi:hypothetical protein
MTSTAHRSGRALQQASIPGLGLGAAFALAACSTPTPSLVLQFSDGPSQSCGSTACTGVHMGCDAVISIRIIDSADPAAPWLSQCSPVPVRPAAPDMCALSEVSLSSKPLPVRDLEVQVAVYPATTVAALAAVSGDPGCPAKVQYSDATGFPVEQVPTPALGGRAYYHPGDPVVTVTLGCTDLDALNESCARSELIKVTSTVDVFPDESSVTSAIASRLTVSVGEPRPIGVDGTFALRAPDTRVLPPVTDGGPTPAWASDVDLRFTRYACIDVVEGVAATTAALRCRIATPTDRLDLSGAWISKDTLQAILTALSTTTTPLPPPDEGLTIGIVVDQISAPVSGVVVGSTAGTVQYLADRTTLGGSATSASGMFVSRDAPFGTVFSTAGPGRAAISAIGGRVQGSVTIVVLQFAGPRP